MASRDKHRERSHRSYRKNVDAFVMFERKARQRKVKTENKSFFQKMKEKLLQVLRG